MASSKQTRRNLHSFIPISDMCEQHKHMAGTAVAERTPTSARRIEALSQEDKVRAAGDKIADLIHTFGREAIEEALKRQKPPSKK